MSDVNHDILCDSHVHILDVVNLRSLRGLHMTVVKALQPEVDGCQFNHVAAICRHGDELLMSIGVQKGIENNAGEEAVVCRSCDGGRSWGSPETLARPELRLGISRSVSLPNLGRLLALQAHFAISARDRARRHAPCRALGCGGDHINRFELTAVPVSELVGQ